MGFFPLAHTASPALTRDELMRYLAELALVPGTILGNMSLRWRSEGPDRLAVSAGAGEKAAAVSAKSRPAPWSGQFSDYRLRRGCWLPFHAEVSWNVDSVKFVYWEGDTAGV